MPVQGQPNSITRVGMSAKGPPEGRTGDSNWQEAETETTSKDRTPGEGKARGRATTEGS